MSDKTSFSCNDLSIADSCCSTSCMFESFNQRIKNLEELLNQQNPQLNQMPFVPLIDDKIENNEVKKEEELNKNIEMEKLKEENKEVIEELEKNKNLINKLQNEKSENEREFNFLLMQIQKMNLGNIKNFDGIQDTSLFTKIAELTTELKNFARETEKVQFIRLSNKIDSCLYTNVNSSDKAYVTVNEGRIEYHETENRKNNYEIVLYAKNSFNKELNCCRSILFYFEVKMIMDNYSKYSSYAEIGFEEVKEVNATIYLSNAPYSGDNQKFNWKNGDTFGCGVVFPPNKSTDSYIFFTKNGKKLGKSIQLQENVDNLLPSISLCLCSVEVNFGNDYFYYDVSKHY